MYIYTHTAGSKPYNPRPPHMLAKASTGAKRTAHACATRENTRSTSNIHTVPYVFFQLLGSATYYTKGHVLPMDVLAPHSVRLSGRLFTGKATKKRNTERIPTIETHNTRKGGGRRKGTKKK